MTEARTCGFRRKRDVPVDGGKAKVCARCDLWFSAGPRERVCFGCLKPAERAARAARMPPTHTGMPTGRNKRQKQQVSGTRSEVLGLTFKPGVPLWRQLAMEAAAVMRWSRK